MHHNQAKKNFKGKWDYPQKALLNPTVRLYHDFNNTGLKLAITQKKSQSCFIFHILSSNHDFKEPK